MENSSVRVGKIVRVDKAESKNKPGTFFYPLRIQEFDGNVYKTTDFTGNFKVGDEVEVFVDYNIYSDQYQIGIRKRVDK